MHLPCTFIRRKYCLGLIVTRLGDRGAFLFKSTNEGQAASENGRQKAVPALPAVVAATLKLTKDRRLQALLTQYVTL